jgi:ParB-like chromosome segregation protein Spo0J
MLHLDSLAEDIRQQGQIVPIELLEGKILDGRRRWLACEKVGVNPKTIDVVVPDPIAYVLSLNRERRHLTKSQLAMVAADAEELYLKLKAIAKERYNATVGRPRKESRARGPAISPTTEQELETITGQDEDNKPRTTRTRDELGKQFGVSGRAVERAVTVKTKGIPELKDAVLKGAVSVREAARIAQLPKEEQKPELDTAKESSRKVGKPRPDSHPSDTDGSDEGGENKTDGRRYKAVLAANETISNLTRSPLMSIGKSNPHIEYAYKKVVDWLRNKLKEKMQ